MATIREAIQQDIEGIAALFNSDPFYGDPWFSTPQQIAAREEELRRFNLEAIAQFVAVDNGIIVGYTSAEQFYLTDPAPPNGKVAEVKKVFVRPTHRGQGVSSALYSAIESKIKDASYDFAVATAVCGHPNSQNLFLSKGYMATGFAPNLINADLTKTSPRESSLYVVKAITDLAKKGLEQVRTVHVPPGAAGILSAAYSSAGLSNLRQVFIDDSTKITEDDVEWVDVNLIRQGGSNPAGQPTLPHVTNDIVRSDRVGRVKRGLEVGGIPVGVLPIGTDRIIMMYVPNGLKFDASKVHVVDRVKSMSEIVGSLYNQQAGK